MNDVSANQNESYHEARSSKSLARSRSARGARAATITLFVALVAGTALRFYGLGDRQLSTLEFYLVTSAHSILDTGLPSLPGGGYYHPGLTAQYAVAAAHFLLGDAEFASRLPSTLFSLGTLALVYIFARPRLGHVVTSALCAALLLSSWEIEFARFARPYTMFQFVAVLLLVSMDRCWWNDGRKLLYLPHAIIGLAALTTEFPPVLAPLLLLPYLTPETIFMQPAGKIRYTAITTTVILAVTLFGRADFRTLGVSNPLPIGVAPEVRAWLEQPVFPFWTLAGDSVRPSVVALGIVAAALACFLVVRRRSSFAWLDDVVSALLLLSVSFHNFLLAAGFATALGALAIRRRGFSVRLAAERHTLLAILLAGVIALGWVTLAAITDDWISVTSRELGYPSLAGGLRLTFFGWPNLYGSLLIPWRNGFPLLGLAVTLACAVELGGLIRGSREQIAKSPALTLLIIASTMGIFAFDDRTVGSSFFLYPLALIVVCNALMRATGAVLTSSDESRKALAPSIAAIAFLCLFGISRDFNPSHLLNMRSHEVSFRLGQFAPYAAIWSGRRDIGTPARQLATAAAPSRTPEFRRGEAIIVQGLPAASLYLPAPYTVYYSREDMRFPRVSRDGGAIDVWSRQHLASTESEIRTICESATTLWILRRRDDDQGFCRAIWPSVRERVVRQGKDGRIEVVRADRIEARAR